MGSFYLGFPSPALLRTNSDLEGHLWMCRLVLLLFHIGKNTLVNLCICSLKGAFLRQSVGEGLQKCFRFPFTHSSHAPKLYLLINSILAVYLSRHSLFLSNSPVYWSNTRKSKKSIQLWQSKARVADLRMSLKVKVLLNKHNTRIPTILQCLGYTAQNSFVCLWWNLIELSHRQNLAHGAKSNPAISLALTAIPV